MAREKLFYSEEDGMNKLRRITATEFRRRTGHFMKQAELCPIVITKRGEDNLVIMSTRFYQYMVSKNEK